MEKENINTQEITEEQIRAYAKEAQKKYKREYQRKHPEKTQQWRRNYIINEYKRIVSEDPALFVEREECCL